MSEEGVLTFVVIGLLAGLVLPEILLIARLLASALGFAVERAWECWVRDRWPGL